MNLCTYAVAKLRGDGIYGTACFVQQADGVLIRVRVCGLPENDTGFYALHVHEGGSCEGEGFPASGSHYNPCEKEHPMHAGDLPPLLACNGRAWLSVKTNRFRLCEVIGRTLIIHRNTDDMHTQPAGNAGTKIACGVICSG